MTRYFYRTHWKCWTMCSRTLLIMLLILSVALGTVPCVNAQSELEPWVSMPTSKKARSPLIILSPSSSTITSSKVLELNLTKPISTWERYEAKLQMQQEQDSDVVTLWQSRLMPAVQLSWVIHHHQLNLGEPTPIVKILLVVRF